MIKLVAFDWNGTIFADTNAIYEGDNEVLKLLRIKPVSLSTFRKYFDVPVKNYYLALGASEKAINEKSQQIANTFHSYYEPRAAKIRTRSNAKKLLDWLSENKVDSVIFSNHITESIKKQLKRLKIESYFSQVLANSHLEVALKNRSKKDRLRYYMEKKECKSSETLIIGDTVEEIDIGRELGTVVISITHGNCSISRLKTAKPDYLINDLKEVIGIIAKLNTAMLKI